MQAIPPVFSICPPPLKINNIFTITIKFQACVRCIWSLHLCDCQHRCTWTLHSWLNHSRTYCRLCLHECWQIEKVYFIFKFYFTTFTSTDNPINGEFRYIRYIPELFIVIAKILLIFRGGGHIEKTGGIYIHVHS